MWRIQVSGLQYTSVITFTPLWSWPSEHFYYSNLQQESTPCQGEAANSSSFHQLIRDNSLYFHTYFSLLPFTIPLQTPLLCLLCAKPKSSQPWISASCLARGGEQLLPRWPASNGSVAPSRSLLGHLAAHGASHQPLTLYWLSTLPVVGWRQSGWASRWPYFPGRMLGSKLLFVIIKGMISNWKPLDFLQYLQVKLSHFSS